MMAMLMTLAITKAAKRSFIVGGLLNAHSGFVAVFALARERILHNPPLTSWFPHFEWLV